MRKLLRSNRGITLIELIIAIGIGVSVLACAYGLVNYGFRTYGENAARIRAQQALRTVALYVSRDLHRADPDEVTIDPMAATPEGDYYADRLTVDGTTYQINKSGEALMNGTPMAGGLTELSFTRTGDTVAYTITGVYLDRNREEKTVTVTSSVTLR
ncbi:MAG: PulJ/GspJ family protein [Christensenellales bacterium]|jgi:Tfp pilus assembly protein PilW